MRVVQLKRGRIVKFATIGLCVLGLLVLLAQKSGYRLRSDPQGDHFSAVADKLQAHFNQARDSKQSRSYPEDKPKFLGTQLL